MRKETYTYEKRDLYIVRYSLSQVEILQKLMRKETYTYEKRDLYI